MRRRSCSLRRRRRRIDDKRFALESPFPLLTGISHHSNVLHSSNELLVTSLAPEVATSKGAKLLKKANQKYRTLSSQIEGWMPRLAARKPDQFPKIETTVGTERRVQEDLPPETPLEESSLEPLLIYQPSREVLALENCALRARIREIEGMHVIQNAGVRWGRNSGSPPDYDDIRFRI